MKPDQCNEYIVSIVGTDCTSISYMYHKIYIYIASELCIRKISKYVALLYILYTLSVYLETQRFWSLQFVIIYHYASLMWQLEGKTAK